MAAPDVQKADDRCMLEDINSRTNHMAITYHRGDLLKAPIDIIAHGCNCKQTMGAGIAKYIAQIYPEVRRADRHFQPQKARDRLGLIDVVSVHKIPDRQIRYVANCYTQLDIGHGVQISYRAIRDCMSALYHYLENKNLGLGIPKIGAGYGGGNWERIAFDIEQIFVDREIQVWQIP